MAAGWAAELEALCRRPSDTSSATGDASSATGDASSATGDASSATGDASSATGDASSATRDASSATGDASSATGDASSAGASGEGGVGAGQVERALEGGVGVGQGERALEAQFEMALEAVREGERLLSLGRSRAALRRYERALALLSDIDPFGATAWEVSRARLSGER